MFVDLERDSTVADVRRAIGAGLRSVEHVKRYTTIGTGSEQGKLANVNAIRVAAELLRVHPGELGTTTFRPPYVPVSFALLAGRDRGELFDPVRVTPIHPAHVEAGAVFEDVGQWKRPRYFPREGEDMDAAVRRECAAARESVAKMDATTLGKIDVQGPDAVEFLNRMYTNAFDSLAVGMCRYAVMCKPDGMVFDDGVVMRVGEQRFLCTTTTGNAAPVLEWMEEWLQTEWPELRVWLTSVTEQWATVAVVGPDSRALLAGLTEIPLDRESFPFMAIREGEVAGHPGARLPRQLLGRARLRGERRRPPRPRALARRSTRRRDAVRHRDDARPPRREGLPDRRPGHRRHRHAAGSRDGLDRLEGEARLPRQALVRARRHVAARPQAARRAAAADERLAEGAQLVGAPARADAGHVTSSYDSAALGRPFALALVERGRERIGETVYADGSRPRSSTRCSTTRRERAVTAVLREIELEARSSVRGEPPPASRRAEHRRRRRLLWLGPDEWLVLGGREEDYPDAGPRRRLGQPRLLRAAGRGRRRRARAGLRARPAPVRLPARPLRADAARPRAGDPLPPTRDTFRLLVRPSFADYLRAWFTNPMA